MGIQEDLKEIKQALANQNKSKEKKFRYPMGKKVGRGQKKKNYVTICLINENGIIDWKKYQIIDQTILHDLIPRLASADYMMRDKKGNPVLILPNWSVEPISPSKHYENSILNGTNKNGYKLLMNRMESEKVDGKKKMGKIVPWIIGIGLAAIIAFAIFGGGGGN